MDLVGVLLILPLDDLIEVFLKFLILEGLLVYYFLQLFQFLLQAEDLILQQLTLLAKLLIQ